MKAIILLILTVLITFTLTGCFGDKDVTKNYGVANIGNDSADEQSADVVVPTVQALTDNLTNAGYSITRSPDITDSKIKTDRILAKNGDQFIDICYGLSKNDTQTVFDYLEKTYSSYYILAINGDYVYCIGDKKTFEAAGFTSLANFGTQYIYE